MRKFCPSPMMRSLGLLLVALALCAVAGFGPPAPAAAQRTASGSSPAAVIRSLYKIHNHGNGPIFQKRGRRYLDKYFDRRLARLIWKNIAGTPQGEVGNLDFDPLYHAQDTKITNFQIGKPTIKQNRATVIVRFTNFGQRTQITYHLHKTDAGWKIENLDYQGGENLIKILSAPL